MSEVERLQKFYSFNDDVLARVEEAASLQEGVSFHEYAERLRLPDATWFEPRSGKHVEVLDIRPKDYESTLSFHLPMGCVLDSNMLMHVGTLAQVESDKRIVAVSNPGQPGRGSSKLSIRDSWRVSNDDLEPTVSSTLEYLLAQGIDKAAHSGISYGADKAAAASENAKNHEQQATHAIMVEPVSVVKRSSTRIGRLIKVGRVFQTTGKRGDRYLEPVRRRSSAFVSAERQKDSMVGYGIGLLRMSNLAIGMALGENGYEGRVGRAMYMNDGLRVGIAWGTASEFDKDDERAAIVRRLKARFTNRRVEGLPLDGQTHAMNLDIFLNAALIAQLLKKTS